FRTCCFKWRRELATLSERCKTLNAALFSGILRMNTAAVDGRRRGLVDHWLHPIREVCRAHSVALDALPHQRTRMDRVCERNVMQQVRNVASDVFVLDASARGQDISIYGWVYSIGNGLIKDLNVTVSGSSGIKPRTI